MLGYYTSKCRHFDHKFQCPHWLSMGQRSLKKRVVSDDVETNAARKHTGKTLTCNECSRGRKDNSKQGEEGNYEAHCDDIQGKA